MLIKTIKIADINPAHYNPRKDLKPEDKEYLKLAKSMKEFDLVEPLVWNKRTGNLVGGHQRLKILKDIGQTEVEVSVVDLTDAKEKALNLALNKISGEWDLPLLKDLLQEIDTGDFDIEITGFDNKEIEDLVNQLHQPTEGLTDDDAVPEHVEPKTKRGDLYKLGNHHLLCGDSTVITDVEKMMQGEKADMVFTDPPYGMRLDTDYTKLRPDTVASRRFEKAKGKTTNKNYSPVIGDEKEWDFNKVLPIDYDIKGALETVKGLDIINPAVWFAPVIKAQGVTSPFLIPPSNNCLMLRPMQLYPSWGQSGTTTFQLGDYGGHTGWTQQTVRSSTDYWMHANSGVSPISLNYTFPANTGWFVEFRAYSDPKAPAFPIFDIKFGQFYWLIIFSDGRADLFDMRSGLAMPVQSGNISHGRHFQNQDVQLVILPFRRQQLLIWSPNLGGFMDVPVTVGKDGNITEMSAPTAYSYAAPPSAFLAITPLLYPADGIAAINAPANALATPLTQTPSFTKSVNDQWAKTALTYTAVTPYEASPPVTSFIYSVEMQGNTAHQTAEAQGVQGIAGATSGTPATSGDSVFSGGTYPYSLFTPFLYNTICQYPRTLGAQTYTDNNLTGILHAKLTLSKDRAQKSFEFTLDNPGDLYTSLKDLQNRRCKVYITNPTLAGGSTSHAAIGADPDPDTPLIVLYGYQPVYIFDGFTDEPDFNDGIDSNLPIKCQSLRKQLRAYVFNGQVHYDGMAVNDVVTDVLQRAGFVGPSDTSGTGMGLEIICEVVEPPLMLPDAVPGAKPLFTPPMGTTAEEFFDTIESHTGWILDDLIPLGATNAAWYWVSPSYFSSVLYEPQGAPDVSIGSTFENALVDPFGTPKADQCAPYPGLGSLSMLADPQPHQTLEELLANYVLVIGLDDQGNTILAQAEDTQSISNRAAVNWIGIRKVYILQSNAINTQAAANYVCSVIYNNVRNARTHLSFSVPDFYPQLGISAPLTLPDYWGGDSGNAIIENIAVDISYGFNKTDISVLQAVAS